MGTGTNFKPHYFKGYGRGKAFVDALVVVVDKTHKPSEILHTEICQA